MERRGELDFLSISHHFLYQRTIRVAVRNRNITLVVFTAYPGKAYNTDNAKYGTSGCAASGRAIVKKKFVPPEFALLDCHKVQELVKKVFSPGFRNDRLILRKES